MESSPYAPISDQCAKALGDKTYDKRKLAAQEIEKMVQEANAIRNFNQVKKIVDVLVKQFLQSRDSNKKKGGLIGLAATSIALGKVKRCETLCNNSIKKKLYFTEF
jgi:vacuole morphology and inheritance protein 14